MYEHQLHPYNGLSREPNSERVTHSVLGAILGYAIGTTLCYSYQDRPAQPTVVLKSYIGGGPEKLLPGELDKTTLQAMELLGWALRPKDFGDKVMTTLRPDFQGSPTDLMEESHRWMLLNNAPNRDTVLGLILGPAILFQPDKALTIARMVQNHPVTDAVVWDYLTTMKVAITENKLTDGTTYYGGPVRSYLPSDGRAISTFNNAVMWVRSGLPFIRTMELICRQGGNTTMVGGLTGSLMGAIYGVKSIPEGLASSLQCSDSLKQLWMDAARRITGI